MKTAFALLSVGVAEGVGISMSQIASYWISKHSKDNCQTAVAVAMAESSGNCGASHDNGGSIDRGLWQINDYWHPECSNSCAYDCSCNAGCAVNVWKSSGWSAWATWKAGAHQKYMNDAAAACGYSSEEIEKETLAASLQVGISMSQIASYWISKHSKDNCQTAVAVAMAESSGNCGASHDNGGSIDRGLWQINDYWHPECSNSCAYDCSCNAGCAVNVWKSSGWSAWATWKAGAHQKYMNDAAVACGYSSEELEKETLAASLQVGYSPDAAVSWADSHCASGSSQCAEFASEAIKAGGHANGCWSTWVPDLDSCLKSNAGWKKTSFPCSKGCVVIWQDSQGPYHAAISRGGGSIDQHNPNRCQSSGSWGDNYCWCPPSFTVTANETLEVVV